MIDMQNRLRLENKKKLLSEGYRKKLLTSTYVIIFRKFYYSNTKNLIKLFYNVVVFIEIIVKSDFRNCIS